MFGICWTFVAVLLEIRRHFGEDLEGVIESVELISYATMMERFSATDVCLRAASIGGNVMVLVRGVAM